MQNTRVSRLLLTAVACAAFSACEAAQVTGTQSGQSTPTGVATNGTRPSGNASQPAGGQQGGQTTASGGTDDAGAGTNAQGTTPGATEVPVAGSANAVPTTGGGAANGNGAAATPGNANNGNAVAPAGNGQPAATSFSWGSLRYAFFGYQRQGAGDDPTDGLELFLTANPNFCTAVPASAFAGLSSENAGAMGMGTLTAGEGSAYLYLPASVPGSNDGNWAGVKDYGTVQISQQTHALTRASQVALSPNTCLLRANDAPGYAAQFAVQALTDDSLSFTLSDPNATSVTVGGVKATAGTGKPSFPYQLTARRCDFYLPLVQATAQAQAGSSSNVGSANPAGGLPYVPCRAPKAAGGTDK